MKSLYIITVIVAITFLSCKSASSKVTDEQIKALETLVENKNFTIESNWAFPRTTAAMQRVLNSGMLPSGSSTGAINLIGNSNFLTISGDSITSYLPYYGERYTNVAYGGTDGPIQLKGVVENYTVSKGKQHSYIISFDAKTKSERFNISMTLYPSLKSYVKLLGNSRSPISYSGHVEDSD
ncbi:DUF4251 domain-containing protein [Hwangdonia lutea]|uniref:DUF4251 domain-containing protein n=1 Tax=Hwangdonia lutea TaxID=3075823 RepID=A0AA97HRC3_9FLAO|nr:DUF4251 domain-containing protein [Hwangdonia sp. SCSIO 19198]WOD43293.1 DUF4251 domain-containing protein [Hwangdonia sp. SCSIO 19198]